MNTTFVRLAIAAILTVAATASYAEIDTYRAHGTIQNIDAASGKVTLMQDPRITSYNVCYTKLLRELRFAIKDRISGVHIV